MKAASVDSQALEQALQRWRGAVLQDPQARWDEARDLAYWQGAAPRYQAARLPLPRTLERLGGLLSPDWSLLDAGAGTGRLARPLAGAVASITALDYSPAMLQEFARLGVPANVTLRQGRFQNEGLPQHDAVLCAWALYRSPDLRLEVRRLARLARQRLFILEDNGLPTPHTRWRRTAQGVPRSDLIAALMAEQLEVTAYHIQEECSQEFASLEALLGHYRVPQAQAEQVLQDLAPHLHATAQGWRYLCPYTVTLLVGTWRVGENAP